MWTVRCCRRTVPKVNEIKTCLPAAAASAAEPPEGVVQRAARRHPAEAA